ncbi:MAG: hypothetical protein ACYC8V_01530 [Caulobacteraceae bacterium]
MTGPSNDGLQGGTFGWNGGFGTSWYMDPSKDLTTIILTSRVFAGPDPPAAHKAFWGAAYRAASGAERLTSSPTSRACRRQCRENET